MIEVHSTAVVHPTARLGVGVRIGAYAVVGEQVSIGDGSILGPHVVVDAFTAVGRECQFYPGSVIGTPPQDLKHQGEVSYLVIGDRNVIREFVTINRATGLGDETRIGDDNLFMAYVHIAHDCAIGNGTILANGVTLAGHVVLEDDVGIGGLTGVHQFVRVGTMSMVGAMTKLIMDVPPYLLAEGNPARVCGPNSIGLRRREVPAQTRDAIKCVYKLLYRSKLNVSQALAKIPDNLRDLPEVAHLIDSLKTSRRGITGLIRKFDADRGPEDPI